MRKINQKKCINANFSNGSGIFNEHFEYPLTDEQETNNGPTGKVVDIQGQQAHTGGTLFLREGKELIFHISKAQYIHILFTEPTFKEDS